MHFQTKKGENKENPSDVVVLNLFFALQDDVEDSHRIPPSPVVHVRGLCDAVVEADLVEALEKFGNIW